MANTVNHHMAYFSNGMSQYAIDATEGFGIYSQCCGAGMHRPDNCSEGDLWFCQDCGATFPDIDRPNS